MNDVSGSRVPSPSRLCLGVSCSVCPVCATVEFLHFSFFGFKCNRPPTAGSDPPSPMAQRHRLGFAK